MTTITDDHSGDVGLRERKKQQTRTAIHRAALQLIDEQGLEATTIEQICQKADVSTRTFFNYYSSKAAAAFEFMGPDIDPDIRDEFLAAHGSLVTALCVAMAASTQLGPDHHTMKGLVTRRPELLPTISKMMIDVRESFVSLAAERAESREQAELAVSLVFSALGPVMHRGEESDEPLAIRLRSAIDRLLAVNAAQLTE